MFYIYILYSKTADKYYVGHSDDPDRRLIEHNTKPFNTYTSKHRPWELVAKFKAGETRSEAVQCERYIKKQKSRMLIEEIVKNQNNPEKLAQLIWLPIIVVVRL